MTPAELDTLSLLASRAESPDTPLSVRARDLAWLVDGARLWLEECSAAGVDPARLAAWIAADAWRRR